VNAKERKALDSLLEKLISEVESLDDAVSQIQDRCSAIVAVAEALFELRDDVDLEEKA
jgi:hypothetical protein